MFLKQQDWGKKEKCKLQAFNPCLAWIPENVGRSAPSLEEIAFERFSLSSIASRNKQTKTKKKAKLTNRQ